jgi:hypothetical protein
LCLSAPASVIWQGCSSSREEKEMAVLAGFLAPDEVYEFIKKVRSELKAWAIIDSYQGRLVIAPTLEITGLDFANHISKVNLLLYSHEDLNIDLQNVDFRKTIDITIGNNYNYNSINIITMTTIQFTGKKSVMKLIENILSGQFHAHKGVEGVNIVFGGSSQYKNMFYSQAALSLLQAGAKWKQYKDDNAEFFPYCDKEV